MEFHEAANIFPLDEEHIDELASDISANGQQVPIEVYDGKILDGRRRWLACERAGVKPKTKDVLPADPVAYVLSLNLHRRHLTPSQASMVGARARGLYDEQAKERQRASGGNRMNAKAKAVPVILPEPLKGDSRDHVGKVVGVSGKLIDNATKVLEKGVPELAEAVDEGRLSVSAAAKVAEQSEEFQKEVAEKAKFSGGRYRQPKVTTPPIENGKTEKGVGVIRANEAINSLSRIPKNDALRKRGFQIVTDWIKHNQ